ncbi:hypothetical protein [Paraburkholderia sp.]|uniref:hypothetical protein n=1 Tax=Paraburkholderia sp. TaxID=1926495 RepID=UPI0039E23A6C
MKQIEREASPQRAICALLEVQPGMTIAEIVYQRGLSLLGMGLRDFTPKVISALIALRLRMLESAGFVRREGYPRLWFRTEKPLPRIVPRSHAAELAAARSRRNRFGVTSSPALVAKSDLESVFSSWLSGA